MFGVLAGALTVVPSQAAASSPPICDSGAVPGDSGQASRQNSSSNGFWPSRRRSPVSAVNAGTCHPAAASAPPSPRSALRSTSRTTPACPGTSPSTNASPAGPAAPEPLPARALAGLRQHLISQLRRDPPGRHANPNRPGPCQRWDDHPAARDSMDTQRSS